MDWMQLLRQVTDICIIPLLGVLTVFIVNFIRVKSKELKEKTDNELCAKYMTFLEDTIVSCVIATNQTYTETLKKQNAFTAEAQKEAFRRTYNSIMSILTDDAIKVLTEAVGDLSLFITQRIEAEVSENKKELKPAAE